MKTFKISSDCHIKIYRSIKQMAILKIPSTVASTALGIPCSVDFKMKPLQISVFPC